MKVSLHLVLNFSRLAKTLIPAFLLASIDLARASDSLSATTANSLPGESVALRRLALREFDRFLDHHPLLEDQLRLKPSLVFDSKFLGKNPELGQFLYENPEASSGLKLYPRYFLYRALLREASAPLPYAELAKLKEVFVSNPGLENELTQKPQSIRDAGFMKTHPSLYQFILQHPALERVFIETSQTVTNH